MRNDPQGTIFGILEKEHQQILIDLDHFYAALERLRYEGKMRMGCNFAQVRELSAFFRTTLLRHIKGEERTLLPFLRKYIPRLEPLVRLILSENKEIRKCMSALRKALRSRRPNAYYLDMICDRGVYLICLLRCHIWLERNKLYRIADMELRENEKRRLRRLLRDDGHIFLGPKSVRLVWASREAGRGIGAGVIVT